MGITGWTVVLQPSQHSTILLQGRTSITPGHGLHCRRLPESGAPVFRSQGCGPEAILDFYCAIPTIWLGAFTAT